MKIQVRVKTGVVGYKSQNETIIDVEYHIETEINTFCVNVLGDTFDVVTFDLFKIHGLDLLVSEIQSDGIVRRLNPDVVVTKHLQGIVTDYIIAGEFSRYQLVYRNETDSITASTVK